MNVARKEMPLLFALLAMRNANGNGALERDREGRVRTWTYDRLDRVTAEMLAGYDTSQLICQHSRVVTDRGIAGCPILIDSPDAILGDSLHAANRSFALTHGACATCYQYGAICTNPSAAGV